MGRDIVSLLLTLIDAMQQLYPADAECCHRIQLDDNNFLGWLTDPKLRRSMELCLQQAKQRESESFWAIYWHQLWRTQGSSLANVHLAAYLQEVCYWNAKKIAPNFTSKQSIADLFQSAIANLPKVLKGFNSQLSSNLRGYADLSFSNIIKDTANCYFIAAIGDRRQSLSVARIFPIQS